MRLHGARALRFLILVVFVLFIGASEGAARRRRRTAVKADYPSLMLNPDARHPLSQWVDLNSRKVSMLSSDYLKLPLMADMTPAKVSMWQGWFLNSLIGGYYWKKPDPVGYLAPEKGSPKDITGQDLRTLFAKISSDKDAPYPPSASLLREKEQIKQEDSELSKTEKTVVQEDNGSYFSSRSVADSWIMRLKPNLDKSNHLVYQLFNRLGRMSQSLDDRAGEFYVTLGDKTIRSLGELAAALWDDHIITVAVRRYLSDWMGLKAPGHTLETPRVIPAVPMYRLGSGDNFVPNTHASLLLQVRPRTDKGFLRTDIEFYTGTLFTGFTKGPEQREEWDYVGCKIQPFFLRGHSEESRGKMSPFEAPSLEALVLLFDTLTTWSTAINKVAEYHKLGSGGYANLGVCNDAVAVMQAANGQVVSTYPLVNTRKFNTEIAKVVSEMGLGVSYRLQLEKYEALFRRHRDNDLSSEEIMNNKKSRDGAVVHLGGLIESLLSEVSALFDIGKALHGFHQHLGTEHLTKWKHALFSEFAEFGTITHQRRYHLSPLTVVDHATEKDVEDEEEQSHLHGCCGFVFAHDLFDGDELAATPRDVADEIVEILQQFAKPLLPVSMSAIHSVMEVMQHDKLLPSDLDNEARAGDQFTRILWSLPYCQTKFALQDLPWRALRSTVEMFFDDKRKKSKTIAAADEINREVCEQSVVTYNCYPWFENLEMFAAAPSSEKLKESQCVLPGASCT
eukprot:gnl/Spiro4/4719_TR2356_c0_g1_i1.p1 gnl/Spiro4/4719_TR2356_c0_g1~~gnl/Spiro4/4719_TR2356_c0_g1_i1.p1  ORF type:complete len:734 (-),score=186.76 gnl/Spiro4/4719_TR2356_c0_g1_i1:35-2236(-)